MKHRILESGRFDAMVCEHGTFVRRRGWVEIEQRGAIHSDSSERAIQTPHAGSFGTSITRPLDGD